MNYFKLKFYFAILFSFSTVSVVAQGNLMKQADEKFEDFKYFEAIGLYKDVIDKKKKNSKNAYVKLAESYYRTSQYRQAAFWYKKAIDTNKNEHDLKFKYAQALMSNSDYEEALKWFEIYQDKVPTDKRTSHFINWCNNIDRYLADSSKYQVKKLAFNSKAHDFSPIFYKSGLVFTSDREDSANSSAGQDDIYTDLFFVEHNHGIRWTDVQVLEGKVQGKYHDGPAVFTHDGKTMYFTRNVKRGKKNRKSGKSTSVLKIYEATWKNEKWDDIKALPFSSSDNSYSIGHPSVSKDGQTMIFTSNKSGGKGGMDLYIVKKKGDSWGTPKNLGSAINTEGNEVFPTIHEDGTLYFSSNGWGGFGGLDIFSTSYKNGKWETANNVGFPINGQYDDTGLTLIPNKQLGYFASNRKGGKGFDDVYELFIEEDKAIELLADKSLIEAPSPIRSSASAVKKVEAEKRDKIEEEIEEAAIAALPEKEMKPKTGVSFNRKSDKSDKDSEKEEVKFSPKEEVNVFVPKNEDVKIGKVFYLIGSVVEYGKDAKEIQNAVIEILDHTDNSKQIHYADKEGNFYMPLDIGHDYTVVHTSQGEIHDFKKIDTKSANTSEVTHVILRGKKPYQLKEYVNKLYERDVEAIEVVRTESVYRTSPTTVTQPTVSTTSSANTATYFDTYTPASTQSIVYKVQLGAFNRDLSTNSNYFRKVDDIIDKESGPSNVKRYLVGSYSDYYSAKSKSDSMKNLGYNSAFVAVYINGVRQEKNTEIILQELGIQP